MLSPWREPVVEATALPINAASAFTQWLHRIGAIVVLPVLGLLGLAAWRRGRRRDGTALLVLATVQGALGLLMVTGGLPLAAVLAHNLVAALLLATLVRLI